jgi:pimeloyl-ACP methyl ester carboxylesterase
MVSTIQLPAQIREIYPFRSHWKKVQGHRIHYVDEGADGGKPTVILLHGNPTWSFLYREIIPGISHVCRAVAPDYLGFGLSDKPRDERWYTLQNHIQAMTKFINGMGLSRVILVVQDWGGPIGLSYALKYPDKVAGMLIMNTWAWPEPSKFHASVMPWRMLHAPLVGAHLFLRKNALVERGLYLSTVRNRERLRKGAVLNGYRLPFASPLSRIGILAFTRNIPLRPGDLNWERMKGIKEGLRDLPFPCRLLWGERDIVFPPSNAYLFQKLIPDCSPPSMIPDGGHFIQEDAPKEIAAEILALLGQT